MRLYPSATVLSELDMLVGCDCSRRRGEERVFSSSSDAAVDGLVLLLLM